MKTKLTSLLLIVLLSILLLGVLGTSQSMLAAEPTSAPDRKIIFIAGITSHNSPSDPSAVESWSDIRAWLESSSLEVKQKLDVTDDDFLYFSYSGLYSRDDFTMPVYIAEDTWINGVPFEAILLDNLMEAFPSTTEFDIIGHSLGGIVATYWAAEIGESNELIRVNSITTLDSPLQGVVQVCSLPILDRLVEVVTGDVIEDLPKATSKADVLTIRNELDKVVPYETANT